MENLGKIFGRLTVKESYVKNKRRYYLCECSCGVIKEIRKDSIIKKEKATRSCGCLKKEQDYKNLVSIEKTHGLTKHRLYKIFLLSLISFSRLISPLFSIFITISLIEPD